MSSWRNSSRAGLLAILVSLLLQITLFSTHTSALPSLASIEGTEFDSSELFTRALTKRYIGTPVGKQGDGGPPKSDYQSDDQIRKDYTKPDGPAVFFTQVGDSQQPYAFAQSVGGHILRGAFPKGYVTKKGAEGGKRSDEWFEDFLDRISGVFAEYASGEVYLVSHWNLMDEGVRDSCSHFSRMEFGTIADKGAVTKITLVDYTNFKNQKTFWKRNDDLTVGLPAHVRSLSEKRAAAAQVCNDWQHYGDDPADPSHGDIGESYKPGWCGLHFRQYQKNEGPGSDTSKYRFDVTIRDSQGMTIGSSYLMTGGGITSALPYVLEVNPGKVDSDPVGFAYADQAWDTGNNNGAHACKVGKYDSGSRQGDCGFTCAAPP